MALSGTWAPPATTRPYIIATAVLGVLVLGLLILYIVTVRQQKTATVDAHSLSAANSQNDTKQTGATTPVGVPAEPTVIHTRTGTVTHIGNNDITFLSTMFDTGSGVYAQVEMTGETGSTSYTEQDKTRSSAPPAPGQPSATSNIHTIDRSALKVGDNIQITSKDNIQGLRHFSVSEIRKLILR